MNTLRKPAMLLAVGLSALAGFVDVLGFLELRGTFVSFMSGNSTQMAISLAQGHAQATASLATIIALFVLGVFIGTLTGHFSRPGYRMLPVLILVTGLMGAACLCHVAHAPFAVIACLAIAMGAENAVFRRSGDVLVGVTYMTGTLVRIAQKLADALTGGPLWAWLPWACLWAGLLAGGVAGALAYARYGLASVMAALGWSMLLTVYAWLCRSRIHGSLTSEHTGVHHG